MKVLGIIPARGGSKGVPDKNIRKVDGKPLLGYAIECGKQSEKITTLVVSTDSEEIATIARKLQTEVILRPKDLASDQSDVIDTIAFTINELKKKGQHFDCVVLLQPTAPLRTGKEVDTALSMLVNDENDAVISVVEVGDRHPARMYALEDDHMMSLNPELEQKRRQDLPKLYLRNGCIYAIKTSVFEAESTMMPSKKSAYVMDEKWWVNVDTFSDLYLLEYLMPLWKKENLK